MTKQASWDGKPSSISNFVNELFSTDVRSLDAVADAVKAGSKNYGFADDTSIGYILNAWLAAWQKHNKDSYDKDADGRCPDSDRTLIGFLSDYIKNNSMQWNVPEIAYAGLSASDDGTVGVYSSTGYRTQSFFDKNGKWNYGQVSSTGTISNGSCADDTVANFLGHFCYGAHIVVVSNSDDLKGGTADQFWGEFKDSSLDISRDITNSHYSKANLTGQYYLKIHEDKEPASNPLIAAFLTAVTDPDTSGLIGILVSPPATKAAQQSTHSQANSFIQLEGWQARLALDEKKTWHMIDYNSSTATLWNFSTFGACAYAEKRCTPMFLAPTAFPVETIDPDTHMPSYNGATKHQRWMRTDLLSIPAPTGASTGSATKPAPAQPANQ